MSPRGHWIRLQDSPEFDGFVWKFPIVLPNP
jgi:hypothetical protein